MVSTITRKLEGYTYREFAATTESREGLTMMGNPPPMDYINMVCYGILRNCPVTPDDTKNAESIFGPDVSSL